LKDSKTGFSRSYVVSLDKARAVPGAWKIILVIESRLAQGSIPDVLTFQRKVWENRFRSRSNLEGEGPSFTWRLSRVFIWGHDELHTQEHTRAGRSPKIAAIMILSPNWAHRFFIPWEKLRSLQGWKFSIWNKLREWHFYLEKA